MSAFSFKEYKSLDYDKFRPSYPAELFEYIMGYHLGESKLAVDIGCGTGVATRQLLRWFDKVIGTDISGKMIEAARELSARAGGEKLAFVETPAEQLPLESGSVDLVTCAQCIHWFDQGRFFVECERVLKPRGTLAYWCYADPVVVGVPDAARANELIEQFTYEDPDKLGPFWEQPGRQLMRDLYRDVQPGSSLRFGRCTELSSDDEGCPLQIVKQITWDEFIGYVRTWSSFSQFRKARGDAAGEQLVSELTLRVGQECNIRSTTVLTFRWKTKVKLFTLE